MAGLTLRPAREADLTSVADVYAHYVNDTVATFDLDAPTVQEWAAKLDQLTTLGWPFRVATVDGAVAGYAYVAPWRPKPAYRATVEDSVYLAPAHTGRGYGRALLADLITETRAAGAQQMVAVISDTGTEASVRLHRALGFLPRGRLHEVGLKHGRAVDVELWQLSLGSVSSPDRAEP